MFGGKRWNIKFDAHVWREERWNINSMLDNPTATYQASIVVLVGRMVKGLGYYRGASKRLFGWFFHFGEWYIVYLAGAFAYKLI